MRITGIEATAPNPTRAGLAIRYALGRAGRVGFRVLNAGGREVGGVAPEERTAGEWSALVRR